MAAENPELAKALKKVRKELHRAAEDKQAEDKRYQRKQPFFSRFLWRREVYDSRHSGEYIPSQTQQDHKGELDIEMVRWTRAVASYTKWLVIVGAVAAGVAYFQWRELRNTDHSIASQLGIMQRQTNLMEREQLPRLGIVDPVQGPQFTLNLGQSVPFGTKGRIGWNFNYTNSGRAEARNLILKVYMRLGENGLFKRAPGVRFPSRHPEFAAGRTVLTTAIWQEDVDQSQFEVLSKTDFGIWTLLVFSYDDIFDKPHTTAYCFAHLAGGGNAIADPEDCQKYIEP
jgi:hypothetical protein